MLNTILYGEYLVVDDQVRLITSAYERFVNSQAFEQHVYINQGIDEENSDDYYSETVDAGTQTNEEIDPENEEGDLIKFSDQEDLPPTYEVIISDEEYEGDREESPLPEEQQ